MDIEERQIDVAQLAPGMFVSRLDRPWTETDFLLQGFEIQTEDDISRLRRWCRHVYVDVQKSFAKDRGSVITRLGWGLLRRHGKPLPPPVEYTDTATVVEELPRAKRAFDDARALAARVIAEVRAGRRVPAEALAAAVESVVASVLRNADAFLWLDALRKRDSYSYSHALNCCALVATFGRHLGFPREMLVDLASAGMLMDVGKSKLPEELLHRDGPLDEAELALARTHLEHGLELLAEMDAAGEEVHAMVRHHHERHDGSGYPNGLSGSSIPLTSRMLGIVDTFDAMASDRPHQKSMSRHDVLQYLYKQRDTLFQAELIEQFSQCLGVYPTGSMVELSSGEIAIVMAQNPARRLFPRVTVLTFADKSIDPAFRQVDLWTTATDSSGKGRIWVARSLPPGAYGLDPSELFL
jgi:HD-GYP domain-containing protein (c-di-GMP phosphodiesterase class II)